MGFGTFTAPLIIDNFKRRIVLIKITMKAKYGEERAPLIVFEVA